ncbi:hypothetical protein AB0D09_17450 [Streptomyces sp. NPDC049097]|uniref:hypothetical protein n=1 Tax=Streptomyces sp. NPDC049097 TaxID=3155497 RepID=UPI003432DCEE
MLRAPAACGPGLALVGDRVIADRPGIRFRGGPPRPAVDRGCAGKAPDGQVTALVSTTSAEQTRVRGRAECEQQTQEVREGLADVRSLAVVPTCARFEPARTGVPPARRWGRTDRCTGRSGTVAGRPVSCRGNHDRQMLVFTRLGSDTALAQTRSLSDAAGARRAAERVRPSPVPLRIGLVDGQRCLDVRNSSGRLHRTQTERGTMGSDEP